MMSTMPSQRAPRAIWTMPATTRITARIHSRKAMIRSSGGCRGWRWVAAAVSGRADPAAPLRVTGQELADRLVQRSLGDNVADVGGVPHERPALLRFWPRVRH